MRECENVMEILLGCFYLSNCMEILNLCPLGGVASHCFSGGVFFFQNHGSCMYMYAF